MILDVKVSSSVIPMTDNLYGNGTISRALFASAN